MNFADANSVLDFENSLSNFLESFLFTSSTGGSLYVNTFNRNNKEYLSVDNSAMVYMLINAVKEQQEQIEALKRKLDELEKNKR